MTAEADIYRRALVLTALALGALAVLAAAVGWLVAGSAAAVAALVGIGVAAIGAIPTQAAMLVGHRRSPQTLAAITLFSWLAKMGVILVALLVLQGVESFHRAAFVIAVAAGLFTSLAIDLWALRKARVPYVDPGT